MKLLCPECGYDMHGNLPPNDQGTNCPECGRLCTEPALTAHAEVVAISGNDVVKKLMLWPAIVFGASVIPFFSLFLMPLTLIAMLIGSIFVASQLAGRVAWTRALNAGPQDACDPHSGSTRAGLFAAFWLVQIALAGFAVFGGCTLAIVFLNILSSV